MKHLNHCVPPSPDNVRTCTFYVRTDQHSFKRLVFSAFEERWQCKGKTALPFCCLINNDELFPMSWNGIRFGTSNPPLAACFFLSPFLKTSLCFLFSVTLLLFSFELQTTIRFSNSFCVSNGTGGHFVPLTTFCSFWNFSKSTQSMESFSSISFFLLSDERALCFHSCTCVKENTKVNANRKRQK